MKEERMKKKIHMNADVILQYIGHSMSLTSKKIQLKKNSFYNAAPHALFRLPLPFLYCTKRVFIQTTIDIRLLIIVWVITLCAMLLSVSLSLSNCWRFQSSKRKKRDRISLYIWIQCFVPLPMKNSFQSISKRSINKH